MVEQEETQQLDTLLIAVQEQDLQILHFQINML